jgi:amidophosphoribosyltransferase
MPGQEIRKRSLNFKLHPIDLEFKGNSVLLVDDSIVRGNTSRKIVEMARKAGARKVYFASASPPIIGPDPYGIDLPTTSELIAADHSIEEIRKAIGADGLFYTTVKDLHKAVQIGNPNIKRFSEGCFTGRYPTPEVNRQMLIDLGRQRNTTRETFSDSEMATDEEGDRYKAMTLI